VMSCLCWMLMMRCCRRFNLGQTLSLHYTRHMRCPQGTSCAELPSNVCTEVLQLQSRRRLRFSSTSSVHALRFMQV
jgi:hypothetical protein